MEERKPRVIPRYIDDTPEIIVIPIDVFFVFIGLFFLFFFINTLLAIAVALPAAISYWRFTKNKPPNYYKFILFSIGLKRVEGAHPPTEKEVLG